MLESKCFKKEKISELYEMSENAAIRFLGNKNEKLAIRLNSFVFPNVLRIKENEYLLNEEYPDEEYEVYGPCVSENEWKNAFIKWFSENQIIGNYLENYENNFEKVKRHE